MKIILKMDSKLICDLLGFYVLLLSLHTSFFAEAVKNPWSTAKKRGAWRATRSASQPVPIDCLMQGWSSWSSCNSCTATTHRFRNLERPSQFQGTDCLDVQWEELNCPKTTEKCLVPNFCQEGFECTESNRCLPKELLCNGDKDCGDWSDENDCGDVKMREDECTTLFPIPGVEHGVQGFNVLSGDFVEPVLDSEYYGGRCEYVYNGEWKKFKYDAICEHVNYNEIEKNYRKPYNFLSYRFLAQATSEGTSEYYEDMNKFLKARQTEMSANVGLTVGVQYVEAGLSGKGENKFIQNITKLTGKDVGFVRLVSKVQTAKFKLRSADLMLSERMHYALMDLPTEYDFGQYSQFLNNFGTHYITQGTMGGTLEYVVVINKDRMEDSKMTGKHISWCLGASFGLAGPLGKNVDAELKAKGEVCPPSIGEYEREKTTSNSLIEDVYTVVKGGTTGTTGGLLAVRDPDTYRKWGATLQYNPTLIEYEIMPIYELIRSSSGAAQVGERIHHLQSALDQYLLEFNSCRCAPCKYNGIPALIQSKCICICKQGYHGEACEKTERKGSTTDGSWSCWGSWSSCQSGKKTRTRACNNPPPEGGITCLGNPSQTRLC